MYIVYMYKMYVGSQTKRRDFYFLKWLLATQKPCLRYSGFWKCGGCLCVSDETTRCVCIWFVEQRINKFVELCDEGFKVLMCDSC